VSLVGAGPGDPDLLTVKAVRALQEADIVVADRLVGPRILDRARRDVRRILVGKASGRPSPTQAEINAILIREAAAGHHVVRLKVGDPMVLGRGGEEIAALRAAGIAVDVVPGITAALGCAAASGLAAAEHIQARLLPAGIGPATPVTVVENDTLSSQKAATGRIAGLTELLIDHGIKSLTLVLVGAHPVARPAPVGALVARLPIRPRANLEEIAA
jgi:siroheme synthase